MLNTWVRVLIRPDEKIFAAERVKAYATLKVAIAWIILVNVAVMLMKLGQDWLVDMWVTPPSEIDPNAIPPKFYLTLGHPIGMLRIWLLQLSFDFSDLYTNMWLLSDTLVDLGFRFLFPVFVFVRDREWLFNTRSVFLNPVYFVLGAGVYHLVAKMLGGRGQFGRYAYLFTLYKAPIALSISLISFLPLVVLMIEVSYEAIFTNELSLFGYYWYQLLNLTISNILTWLVSFYTIVLAYLVTRAEHRLAWWRAIIVVVVGYCMALVIRNSLFYSLFGLMDASRIMRGG